MPEIKEASTIAAFMLYDAARIFPRGLQKEIQKQFRSGPHTGPMLIEFLSTEAHQGIASVPEDDESHLWQMDLASGDVTGTLFEALCSTKKMLTGSNIKQTVTICGKLARYCADGFLFLNTVSFEDWQTVSYRFIHDVAVNLKAMPFLWEQILKGDSYKDTGAFSDTTAMQMALNEGRQQAVNIGNAYLFGNGWPVVDATARIRYNKATNMLAEAVLSAVGV